jgi:hypothetical protein
MYNLSDMNIISEHPLSELENYKHHKRLRVFWFFGTQCVACDRQGTRLIVLHHKTIEEYKTVDVFTDRMHLMTVDHIIPKSQGGRNTLDNMQPMCQRCNNIKADHYLTNEELRMIVREKVRSFEVSEWVMAVRNREFRLGL